LDESEKKQILSLYNKEKNTISEQTLNSDGTYYLKGDHKIKDVEYGYEYLLKAKTQVYKSENTVCFRRGCEYSMKCSEISKGIIYDQKNNKYTEVRDDKPITAMVKKLFCSKQKQVEKPKPIEKVFTEDKICRLTDDKVWIYAKDENGKWWASKDGGKKWFELKLPKFKEAVDILNRECPKNNVDCKTKCNAKPLQPGQTGPQVEMWFYGAVGCYQATGSKGFSTREECEACKCSDKIGEGGSKEDCFDKFGCLEKLIEDKILLRWDDFDECGCYHGNPELSDYGNCIFYCDGTAWCEIGIGGDGDIFNWSCNQGKIDMDKEKPIQREKPKPKKPIDGGKDDGDQDFPLF